MNDAICQHGGLTQLQDVARPEHRFLKHLLSTMKSFWSSGSLSPVYIPTTKRLSLINLDHIRVHIPEVSNNELPVAAGCLLVPDPSTVAARTRSSMAFKKPLVSPRWSGTWGISSCFAASSFACKALFSSSDGNVTSRVSL